MPFRDLQGELIRALGKISSQQNPPPVREDYDREGRAAGDPGAARRQSKKGRKPKG